MAVPRAKTVPVVMAVPPPKVMPVSVVKVPQFQVMALLALAMVEVVVAAVIWSSLEEPPAAAQVVTPLPLVCKK